MNDAETEEEEPVPRIRQLKLQDFRGVALRHNRLLAQVRDNFHYCRDLARVTGLASEPPHPSNPFSIEVSSCLRSYLRPPNVPNEPRAALT